MTTNESLGDILEEEMPIERLSAECGVCGFSMFDSNESISVTPHRSGDIIVTYAEKHRNMTGHNDLQIEIDKQTPIQKIDSTISINE